MKAITFTLGLGMLYILTDSWAVANGLAVWFAA